MSIHIAIIGGGPAGYVAALHARDLGAEVTLITGNDLGGTCLWRGCIPTKTLVASSKVLMQARRADQFGLKLEGRIEPDWQAMKDRAGRIVENSAKGIEALLRNRGVQLIAEDACFVEGGRLTTTSTVVSADRYLLCTGSKPFVPRGIELDGKQVGSSDDVLNWSSLPKSVLIIGGGVIACEFAFILNALGTQVTLVERLAGPLPGEDRDVQQLILREMKKRKIRFIAGTSIERLDTGGELVRCFSKGECLVEAERVVVAVGRKPNTFGLGLENLAIALGERGEVAVDEHMMTTVPGVYAAGDVAGGLMLAHNASFQGRVAVNHMLGVVPDSVRGQQIPRVTFTDPEVASIGLTEQAARDLDIEVAAGRFDLRSLGMAQALGELAGFAKVVVDRKTGVIVGIHIVGAHASEMINEASVLLNQEARVSVLAHAVHAHPTLSEALVEAAEAALGQAIHQLQPVSKPTREPHNEPRQLSVS